MSSSDCYKLYSNEMFELVQRSELGVQLGPQLVLSAVGQADDAVIMSNDLEKLKFDPLSCHRLLYKVQCPAFLHKNQTD